MLFKGLQVDSSKIEMEEKMEKVEPIKSYHIVFQNKFVSNINPVDVQEMFVSTFNVPEKKCSKIFSGRRVRLKKGVSQQVALNFQEKLFKIGMLCDIELNIDSYFFSNKEKESKHKTDPDNAQKFPPKINMHVEPKMEDEDEDDVEADFDLSEILHVEEAHQANKRNAQSIVEVIKFYKKNIVDIQYLHIKDKYVDTDTPFCLADYDSRHNAYFYFDEFIQGNCYDFEDKVLETESLRVKENLYHKKKRIFRHPIPDKGHVRLNSELYTYHIRKKKGCHNPPPKIPKRSRSNGLRFLMKSIGCHLLILLLIGLFVSLEKPNTIEKNRFATIAGNKIHDLQKLRKKRREISRPQKLKIARHEPVPEKIVQPTKKVQRKPLQTMVSKKNIVKKYHSTKKTKVSTTISGNKKVKRLNARRSKQRGNNGGKAGNVSTPNVNQKGLLGMIKDTGLSLLNTEALAAVTQLDTVEVPGNFGNNTLKVKGIKANLGDRKVHMPLNFGGGRVNTKGAHQVLQTGNGDGSGGKSSGSIVGELSKGNTGNNAVKAMIRANFRRSVHQIQGGGMSRAAVKKVIDQHIDDITYCYEVALISDPSIVGKAVYEWRILMNGSVSDVHILNASIQNQEILGCIKRSIKTWTFPQPHRAQVLVSYPFVFDIVGF